MERIRQDLIQRAHARRGDAMQRRAAIHEFSQTSTVRDAMPSDDTNTPRLARVLPRPLEASRQTDPTVSDDSGTPETPKSPETTASGDGLHQRIGSTSTTRMTNIVEPPVSQVTEPSPAVVAGTINLAQDIEAQPVQQDSRGLRRRGIVEKMQSDRKKRFLFCLPLVKSARVRVALLHALTSGLFVLMLLAVYLGLSLTQHIQTSELTIILLLITVVSTIFFCYNIIRLCVAVRRGGQPAATNRGRQARNPADMLRTGYAMPRQPIRVVLAQDAEVAGREAVISTVTPPAYGFWRESVRLDPDRLYWQRNEAATREETVPEAESAQAQARDGRRPPSYISEDGVSYVVDAMTASSTSTPMTTPRAGRGQTA